MTTADTLAGDRVLALWAEAAAYVDDVADQARLVCLAELAGWEPAYFGERLDAHREASAERARATAKVPGTISIYCRSCGRLCSRRMDTTWRHDHDGTVVTAVGCADPDVIAGHDRTARTVPDDGTVRVLIHDGAGGHIAQVPSADEVIVVAGVRYRRSGTTPATAYALRVEASYRKDTTS